MPTSKQYKEIGARKESVSMICNKLSEEGAWDSMKARDVPQEIVQHVLSQIDIGKDPREIRKELGIHSQTSKEWQKIAAAIKIGYRVNAPTYFHRLIGRNEKIADKLYKVIDKVLDTDVDYLMDNETKEGERFLKIFAKDVTPMIDAMNRLQQGTVKIGKDLGVFADTGGESKGSGGVTMVIKTNVILPSPQELVKQKKQKIIEAEVVESKNKVPRK